MNGPHRSDAAGAEPSSEGDVSDLEGVRNARRADDPSRGGGAEVFGSPHRTERGIPEATIARLPVYLRALTLLADRGTLVTSSHQLASTAGVNSAKLRKDLSYLGTYGTRGVGYDVAYLRYQIAREIGLTQDWPVVIVGLGNLGQALANYSGFSSRGFRVVGLLDADRQRVGERFGDHAIRDVAELEDLVKAESVAIAVITTPPQSAQGVADRLVAAGVRSILNFAPVVISVPDGVDVRKVDRSIELQILAYHEQRRSVAPDETAGDHRSRPHPAQHPAQHSPHAPQQPWEVESA